MKEKYQLSLKDSEIDILKDLLTQEINFCYQEPEHEEEIQIQVEPYEELYNKLEQIRGDSNV